MPFTILKVSKINDDDVEVVGEFADEDEANQFVEDQMKNSLGEEGDYIIERPPSQS